MAVLSSQTSTGLEGDGNFVSFKAGSASCQSPSMTAGSSDRKRALTVREPVVPRLNGLGHSISGLVAVRLTLADLPNVTAYAIPGPASASLMHTRSDFGSYVTSVTTALSSFRSAGETHHALRAS